MASVKAICLYKEELPNFFENICIILKNINQLNLTSAFS